MRQPLHVPAILLVLLAGSLALAPPLVAAESADGTDDPLVLVRGIVRDDAGHPLADVEVTGNVWAEDRESYDVTTTGAEGTFELRLHEGKAHVNAWSRELQRGAEQGVEVAGNDTYVELTIQRPPPRDAIVTGTVTDSDGEPIPGARVTIGQSCCYAYPASDMEKGEGTTGGSAESEASAAVAEPATTEPAAPMPIRCCYDGDFQETFTDDDGRYRFETYGGPRQVTAHAKGYAQTGRTVDATSNDTVTADLRLEKVPDADALLEGTVVDAETGLPIANANVWLNNLEWSTYGHATTGADGKFRIETIPGWVQVSISVDRYCCAAVEVDPAGATDDLRAPAPSGTGRDYRTLLLAFDAERGTDARTFELVPKPAPSVVLTGYVVDPTTDTGVEGAWVNFWNQDTGDWGQAQTDATGSYRITVRPGYHQVTAWKEGHLNGASTVMVEPGDAAKRHDVLMPKGTPKNSGCWDCHIAYAEDADGGYATRTATPTMAPQAAMEESAGGGDAGTTREATKITSDGGAGEATYQGSGGGLPPYSAQAEGATTSSNEDTDAVTNATPGFGLALLIGAAALVALAARRTRRD